MKSFFIIWFMSFNVLCLFGQSQTADIILSSKDVDSKSVRIITQPEQRIQNVVAHCVGKTSAEIKAICDNPKTRAVIMKDGVILAETKAGRCGAITENGTNYIGVVLMFDRLDQAKLAEKGLRGDK